MSSIWITTVLPIIGNLLAVGLFASPWIEVKVARASGDNGKLNAVPYAAMLAQCACWVVYAAVQNSLAVAPINLFGCICGLIFCVSTMRNVKDRDEYLRQERLFFLALALPSVCLLIVCMAVQDLATKINILGYICLAFNLAFLTSPLSTVSAVIREKDSTSISGPLSTMQLVCAIFWALYCLGIQDYFLLVPQIIGTVLASFQLAIKRKYRVDASASSFDDAIADSDASSAVTISPPSVQTSATASSLPSAQRQNPSAGLAANSRQLSQEPPLSPASALTTNAAASVRADVADTRRILSWVRQEQQQAAAAKTPVKALPSSSSSAI